MGCCPMDGRTRFLWLKLALGYQGMSSLWTPGGEHRPRGDQPASAPERPAAPPQEGDEELSEDERRQLEEHLAEMQRQLLDTPARAVIANHAIGLFQLATLHLSVPSPDLDEARLAIDAMAAIVEGLGQRLGAEEERALTDALHQARLGFVETSRPTGAPEARGSGPGGEGGSATAPGG